MEYLQYSKTKKVKNLKTKVLNLIINGIPSIPNEIETHLNTHPEF